MGNKNCEKNNLITPELILRIYNDLNSLGIKRGRTGFRLLFEALKIGVKEYDENSFSDIQVYSIYKQVANSLNLNKTPRQISDMIYYAITRRNYPVCEKNFEKVFGYPYDEEVFSNKEFINTFITTLKLKEYC